jgi:hypothetical protein
MSRIALDQVSDKDFDAISQYYVSGSSERLSIEHQQILDRWRAAADILRKFPTKAIAVRKLVALFPDITIRQAHIDINNATKFWNIINPTDKLFLQSWLTDFLLKKLTSESVSEPIKAKYSATLERLISSIQEEKLDPKFMEQNVINIQFNIAKSDITFSEHDLKMLPKHLKEKILSLTHTEISETDAIEIINS